MLKHLYDQSIKPARVVILGALGFVGSTVTERLKLDGVPTLALGRQDVDLIAEDAGAKLAKLLKAEDSLLVISAQAPVKDNSMLEKNIRMMSSVCDALGKVTPAHVVYVSSDAVYADSMKALNETSCAQPGSLHGVMHLVREVMLKNACVCPLAFIRPTLIYGVNDPHNGYGPNRFRRLAADGKSIVLFGEGEEQRDHVLVDDVADLIVRMLTHQSHGVLNAATGVVTSFKDIAEMVLAHFDNPPVIQGSPRQGEMPHNGYRAFDPAITQTAFPDFEYTPLAEGIARTLKGLQDNYQNG